MKKLKLGYELRIGNRYIYYDTETSEGMLCKLINIIHDGDYVVYEFKHNGSRAIGATIYPTKFKPFSLFNL